MQLKATSGYSLGFLVLILCIGFTLNTTAQPPATTSGLQDLYLSGTGLLSRDSISKSDEKKKLALGAGSIMTKYGKANRLYFNMIDSLSKILFKYPIADSAGLTYAEEWVGTPNMGLRRPNYVIIHHTANNSCDETLREFTTAGGREASAHYVICKDGTVHHMLNDLLRSHHAGESKWGNNTDLNSSSIGIELDNNGYQPFSEAQINSLNILLERLKEA